MVIRRPVLWAVVLTLMTVLLLVGICAFVVVLFITHPIPFD